MTSAAAAIATAAPAIARRRFRPFVLAATCARTGWVLVGVIPPLGVASGSRADIRSPAVWKRSAGRLARQRMITASSAGESPVRCVPSGVGSRMTCAARVCCGFNPWNGGYPESIS